MSESEVLLRPPTGFPPVVVSVPFDEQPDGAWGQGEVSGGRLVLAQHEPGAVAGVAAHPRPLRDVVLDGVVALTSGGEDDLVGWYLRQSAPDRYLACVFGPTGRVGMLAIDGEQRITMVGGRLAPGLPFDAGLGQPNRVTVVACGPSVTLLLNGAVVAGVTVDHRFAAGHAGPLLVHGATAGTASAEVHWLQVRALLADQADDVRGMSEMPGVPEVPEQRGDPVASASGPA